MISLLEKNNIPYIIKKLNSIECLQITLNSKKVYFIYYKNYKSIEVRMSPDSNPMPILFEERFLDNFDIQELKILLKLTLSFKEYIIHNSKDRIKLLLSSEQKLNDSSLLSLKKDLQNKINQLLRKEL